MWKQSKTFSFLGFLIGFEKTSRTMLVPCKFWLFVFSKKIDFSSQNLLDVVFCDVPMAFWIFSIPSAPSRSNHYVDKVVGVRGVHRRCHSRTHSRTHSMWHTVETHGSSVWVVGMIRIGAAGSTRVIDVNMLYGTAWISSIVWGRRVFRDRVLRYAMRLRSAVLNLVQLYSLAATAQGRADR